MVNQEILWGLKSALERGQSLKKAMLSFYNAGYNKNEIEESAKYLTETGSVSVEQNSGQLQRQRPVPTPESFNGEEDSSFIPAPSQENVQSEKAVQKPRQVLASAQNVSAYEQREGTSGKLVIVILCAILFLLFGILVLFLIFRNEFISWFSNLM